MVSSDSQAGSGLRRAHSLELLFKMLANALRGDGTEGFPISSLTQHIQIESAGQAAATLPAAACGALSSVGLCLVFSSFLSLEKDSMAAGLVLHRRIPVHPGASPPLSPCG